MLEALELQFGWALSIGAIGVWVINALASDMIVNWVKGIFNTKTKKGAKRIFNGLDLLILIIGVSLIFSSNEPVNKTSENDQSTIEATPKEILIDTLVGLSAELFQQSVNARKAKKDSILNNRNKHWVFRIGGVKENDKLVFNLYKKLARIKDLDTNYLSVFKSDRKSYFVYYDRSYDEIEIEQQFPGFLNLMTPIEPNVEIYDLMTECKWNHQVIETKPLKSRKDRLELPCFECDKK